MNKNLIFLLVISLVTCSVEVDISVPSFPNIADHFNISYGLTQMTIALNFLGFCLSSMVYGPLSECYGRRRIMLVGNGIMVLGAVGCMIANSIEFLLLSRFIQGIGASTSAVVAFAMIADIYSAKKSAKLIGKMNSLITILMSIAPIAGGFINETLGWRSNYITIAVISIVSWIMLYFWLPETKKQYNKLSIRKIGNDFRILFLSNKFLLASFIPSICFAGWMSFVSCAAFLYMETYNLPIMHYVFHQGVIISAFSIVSLYSGQIIDYWGEKNCVTYGMICALIGSLLMTMIAIMIDKSPYLTSMSIILYSIGAAISYPVIFVKSLNIFPKIKGTASSAIMTMRALICAVFVAISGYFYSGKLINVAMMLLLASALITIFSIRLLKIVTFAKKEENNHI